MSTSPLVVLVAALLAGSAAAVATVSLLPGDAPSEDPSSSRALQAVASLRADMERLADAQAALRHEVQSLDLRLSTAGRAAGDDGVQPLTITDPTVRALQEQVAQLAVQVGGGGDVREPQVIETVSAALEQIREQEDAERRELRAEARRERQAERLDELTQRLSLDSYQASRLSEVMAGYGESSDLIVEAARKAGDWGGMRGRFDALNGTVNEQLGVFLKPDQLAQFEALGGPRILTGDGWWGRMNDTTRTDGAGTEGGAG